METIGAALMTVIERKTQWHTMLDIETMGTRPGCAIMSIGACRFDPDTGYVATKGDADTFYERITFRSNIESGLTFSIDTLMWWLDQSKEAQKEAFSGIAHLREALLKYGAWYRTSWATMGPTWSHGSRFDHGLVENAYRKLGMEPCWDYKQERDTRTMLALFPSIKIPRSDGVFHVAVDDAINQAVAICQCYAELQKLKQFALGPRPTDTSAIEALATIAATPGPQQMAAVAEIIKRVEDKIPEPEDKF